MDEIARELAQAHQPASSIAATLNLNVPYVCKLLNIMVDAGRAQIVEMRPSTRGGHDCRIYGLKPKAAPCLIQSLLQQPWGAQA